ncbi:hypothetical protein RE628_16520 [Paenibacillus sp. D2_2]|nr:hypothetical protein [Paenibacillus sp. D2_2]WMT39106.1 hypothetical protein RE628_16520 [Paenibacillus sp. D2_2]
MTIIGTIKLIVYSLLEEGLGQMPSDRNGFVERLKAIGLTEA